MTGNGAQLDRKPVARQVDIRWMARASCRLEESKYWTEVDGDRRGLRPARAVLDRLARVCHLCPVRRECARYALTAPVEGGMYAGVWLPATQRNRTGARAQLTTIAYGRQGGPGNPAPAPFSDPRPQNGPTTQPGQRNEPKIREDGTQ